MSANDPLRPFKIVTFSSGLTYRKSRTEVFINWKPATPKSNYAISALMLFAGVAFAFLSIREVPERTELVKVSGIDPGFSNVQIKEGARGYRSPSITFGEQEGRKCTYQGPFPWDVVDQIKPGVRLEVLCENIPWIDGWSRVYEITANAELLVAYDDVVRYAKRERWMDAGLALLFTIGFVAFLRRGRSLGSTSSVVKA